MFMSVTIISNLLLLSTYCEYIFQSKLPYLSAGELSMYCASYSSSGCYRIIVLAWMTTMPHVSFDGDDYDFALGFLPSRSIYGDPGGERRSTSSKAAARREGGELPSP